MRLDERRYEKGHLHLSGNDRELRGRSSAIRDVIEFDARLETLGYRYVDESGNPAYRLFLG